MNTKTMKDLRRMRIVGLVLVILALLGLALVIFAPIPVHASGLLDCITLRDSDAPPWVHYPSYERLTPAELDALEAYLSTEPDDHVMFLGRNEDGPPQAPYGRREHWNTPGDIGSDRENNRVIIRETGYGLTNHDFILINAALSETTDLDEDELPKSFVWTNSAAPYESEVTGEDWGHHNTCAARLSAIPEGF